MTCVGVTPVPTDNTVLRVRTELLMCPHEGMSPCADCVRSALCTGVSFELTRILKANADTR